MEQQTEAQSPLEAGAVSRDPDDSGINVAWAALPVLAFLVMLWSRPLPVAMTGMAQLTTGYFLLCRLENLLLFFLFRVPYACWFYHLFERPRFQHSPLRVGWSFLLDLTAIFFLSSLFWPLAWVFEYSFRRTVFPMFLRTFPWSRTFAYAFCFWILGGLIVMPRNAPPPPLFPVFRNQAWGFADRHGTLRVAAVFEQAMPFADGLALVREGGLWGLLDIHGNWFLRPSIATMPSWPFFSEGVMGVAVPGGFGLANHLGRLIASGPFEDLKPRSQELAPAKQNGKWGFIDNEGKWMIPPHYEDAGLFRGSLAPVKTSGRWGYINSTDEMRIPAIFDLAMEFWWEGKALVQINNTWYHLSLTGSLSSLPEGQTATLPVPFPWQGRWGFLWSAGNPAIPPIYERAQPFAEGLAAVRREGLYGYIDTTGKTVIPFDYYAAQGFAEGLAPVRAGAGWQYIDSDGEIVIAPLPFFCGRFSEGRAFFRNSSYIYGYLDRSGREVIPAQFRDAFPFSGGTAEVVFQKKRLFIAPNGDFIVPPQATEGFSEGVAAFSRAGKKGYQDRTGQILVPPVFDEAAAMVSGRARIQLSYSVLSAAREPYLHVYHGWFDRALGLAITKIASTPRPLAEAVLSR